MNVSLAFSAELNSSLNSVATSYSEIEILRLDRE